MKYDKGVWNEPGIGGQATALSSNAGKLWATSSAFSQALNKVLLVGGNQWLGGLMLSYSTDKIGFTTLRDPLIPYDQEDWVRVPAPPRALFFASSLIDPISGGNTVGNQMFFWYVYIPANAGFNERYLVLQTMDMSETTSGQSFQVGRELMRWRNTTNSLGLRRTTTLPVPGSGTSMVTDQRLGYMMTAAPPSASSVELIECLTNWAGHDDYFISTKASGCSGAQPLGTVGWLYTSPQTGTAPIYRCYDAINRYHFLSREANCESLGQTEFLFGYIPVE